MARKWLVGLEGHSFDLEELQDQLQSKEVSIEKRDNKYYLGSSCFTGLQSVEDVLSAARRLVEFINGSARIFVNGYKPVSSTVKKWGQPPYFSAENRRVMIS